MSDHDFNTPPDLLDLVRKLDVRGIGLDPCSNEHSLVCAKTEWLEEDDGLTRDWTGYGLVFVNPPHSQSPNNIEPWVGKICTFARTRGQNDSLVVLAPAKTDTAWFHALVTRVDCTCFLKGRPKFYHLGKPTNQSGKFPSMVMYFGPVWSLFRRAFGPLGWVI